MRTLPSKFAKSKTLFFELTRVAAGQIPQKKQSCTRNRQNTLSDAKLDSAQQIAEKIAATGTTDTQSLACNSAACPSTPRSRHKMQRTRRSGALLATLLATAVAVAPARHGMHMRALHLTGGANATSLAPEPKAPSDASLTARLFGAIRKTVRLTLRLLGFGKDEDAADDAAPATGKKKKAAAKKRRSPARASPAQRQAQRISRELTDFVENRAESTNHRASYLASRVDGVRADASRRLRRCTRGRNVLTTHAASTLPIASGYLMQLDFDCFILTPPETLLARVHAHGAARAAP